MKILFIGAVQFSDCSFQELIAMQANIVGICTLLKSTNNSEHVDITPIAEKAGIPVRVAPDINSVDVCAWIQSLNPDVIFSVGWSQIIKSNLLAIPPPDGNYSLSPSKPSVE